MRANIPEKPEAYAGSVHTQSSAGRRPTAKYIPGR